jgi:hypothetical protein
MKRLAGAIALSASLLLSTGAVTFAVTDGALDGNAHPYVGLMVAQQADGTPLWRCSGTLISSTLFLTAGHCTEAPAAHVEIWFDADMQTDAAAKNYPAHGQVGGTPHTHPQYDPDVFWKHDLGMVVLDKPMDKDSYGKLPGLNLLDQYKTKRGINPVRFDSVGYGLQKSFPDAAAWKEVALRIRMVAHPRLIQINNKAVGEGSILLSNNANTGGTCFGDSGGPNFLAGTSTLAGVTSFGRNSTCAGTGGVYRVDRADDLGWIATFQE